MRILSEQEKSAMGSVMAYLGKGPVKFGDDFNRHALDLSVWPRPKNRSRRAMRRQRGKNKLLIAGIYRKFQQAINTKIFVDAPRTYSLGTQVSDEMVEKIDRLRSHYNYAGAMTGRFDKSDNFRSSPTDDPFAELDKPIPPILVK